MLFFSMNEVVSKVRRLVSLMSKLFYKFLIVFGLGFRIQNTSLNYQSTVGETENKDGRHVSFSIMK